MDRNHKESKGGAEPIDDAAPSAAESAAASLDALMREALGRMERGDHVGAVAAVSQAVAIRPDDAQAHHLLGFALRHAGKLDEAIMSYTRALALRPDYPDAHVNLANAFRTKGLRREAERCYKQAIALDPRGVAALMSYGHMLSQERRLDDAIAQFHSALAAGAEGALPHLSLGNAFMRQGKYAEAAESFRQAVAADPDRAKAHNNLGAALARLGRPEESIASCRRAVELQPRWAFGVGQLVFQLQHLALWDDWRNSFESLRRILKEDGPGGVPPPFITMSMPFDAAEQKRCAEKYARRLMRSLSGIAPHAHAAAGERKRLRIGYLSADFHDHATAYLLAEVLELHNRRALEINAYSYGRIDTGKMRPRLVASCDAFQDMRGQSFAEMANKIAADKIDILVDLKGYTLESRSEVLALRPAPIQVNWLGYPGTMGAPFVDYLIGDPFVIPAGAEKHFTERIVRLPHSYQPNDRKRPIGPARSRADHGLPEDGFVFCCFNQPYKILPDMFAAWMRILTAVPGGVIWLLEKHSATSANLRRAAEAHGIDPARLIFAPKVPLPDHLTRYRVADLALDTFPYTSHTTASDALWAGCPIVTLAGETFASRVAGSLLKAAGLPDLVTTSLDEFERLAIRLATEDGVLDAFKQRLAAERDRCALFDAPRFVRHLEAAYREMWNRYRNGRRPEAISIQADPNAEAKAHHRRGLDAMAQDKVEEAIASYRQALLRDPDYAKAHNNLGVALRARGEHEAALASFGRAIELDPGYAKAYNNLGTVQRLRGELKAAIASFQRATVLAPDYVKAYVNLCQALRQDQRPAEACGAYIKAIALAPDDVRLRRAASDVFSELGIHREALGHIEEAVRLEPDSSVNLFGLALRLSESGNAAGAVESYRKALELDPKLVAAWNNLGNELIKLGKMSDAIDAYRNGAAAGGPDVSALEQLVHRLHHLCRWHEAGDEETRLRAKINNGAPVLPFPLVAFETSADVQRRAAEQFARRRFPERAIAAIGTSDRRERRLRVGYLSADLRVHATTNLIGEVFELHDRAAFEIFAYSYGRDDKSPVRERVRNACDKFVDVRSEVDPVVAKRIAGDGIDVLVDLKGYTMESRTGIMAMRPAPIQVNWLGYPGTMGATFIDYIIGDPFVIPAGAEKFYTEKIVRLPDTYQPNDRSKRVGPRPERAAAGLPENALVFCSFNQVFKVQPSMFAAWMRIMVAVPGSVLWLLEKEPEASDNLRRAAKAHGIAPQRLVFGRAIAPPNHLARYLVADLALDTFPCTSHTTASDALWAGCPLVTLAGETFASRVAASLLHAAGLPGLVTQSFPEFENLAIRLATDQAERAAVRKKLAEGRDRCALFDTPRFVRNLEAAYRSMWDIRCSGRPPQNFAVATAMK